MSGLEKDIPILLVDDHPENILALEAVLDDPAYNLLRASSGNEALAAVLEHDVALVLLDVQMPEMDGYEVAQLMRKRQRTRHIPIIFITAISNDLQRVFQGYEAGAVDYLAKPFAPEMLQAKVVVFCELYRQRRALEAEAARRMDAEVALRESEQRYRLLVELSPLAMFVACGQRIVYTNTAFLKLLGEDNRDNIIGANPSSFLDEESRSRFQDAINATELRGGRENLSGVRVQRVDQTTVDVEIGMTIVVYDHETGVQVFVNDVTEQRKAAQALADSEARYRIIAEFTSDFVYWRASDGKLLYVSPSALDFCGYAPAELERRPNLLTEMVHPDDRDLWMRHMLEEKMSQSPRPVEFRILTREGVVRWVTHVCRPVMGADGGYQGVRASDRDITRRRIMEEELRRLTNQDGLTGISNRRYFDEEYDKEWRRALRAKAPLSVVLMDVDHFKAYNDTYGHQMGDECLRNVAGVLQSGVKRPGDVVARYGGEEFVLILPNTPLLAAREIAEQMRRTIAALEIEHSKSPVASVVSISAGIAGGVPAAGMDSRLFIEQADKALYEAKHSGRNRVALAGALSAGSLG